MMFCDGFPVLFFTVSDCLTMSTGTGMVIFTRASVSHYHVNVYKNKKKLFLTKNVPEAFKNSVVFSRLACGGGEFLLP